MKVDDDMKDPLNNAKGPKKNRFSKTLPIMALIPGLFTIFKLPPATNYLKGFIQGGSWIFAFMGLAFLWGKLIDEYMYKNEQIKNRNLSSTNKNKLNIIFVELFAEMKIWTIAALIGICLAAFTVLVLYLLFEIIKWASS